MDNWISVKDKLPETGEEVLVAVITFDGAANSNYVTIGWCAGEGYWSEESVTHWMPLPEPPKGE